MSGRVAVKQNIPLKSYKSMNTDTARKELQQQLIENIRTQTEHVRKHNELVEMYKKLDTEDDSSDSDSSDSDSTDCDSDSETDSYSSDSDFEKTKPSKFQKFIKIRTLQLRKERPNLKDVQCVKLANIEWRAKHNLNSSDSDDDDNTISQFDSNSEDSDDPINNVEDIVDTMMLNSVQYKKFVTQRLPTMRKEHPELSISRRMTLINREWDESPYVKFFRSTLSDIRKKQPNLNNDDCYKLINKKWDIHNNSNKTPYQLSPYQIFMKDTIPKIRADYPNLENRQYMEMANIMWPTINNLDMCQKFNIEMLPKLKQNYPYLTTENYDRLLHILWISKK